MTIGIMQPYFMPYIGYWQLINAVDKFILYDNIQYTKKGWINRNRVLNNSKDVFITLPLEKDSDYLNVVDRKISKEFDKNKFVNQISEYYRKAPNFSNGIELFKSIMQFENKNLFEFIYNSVIKICDYLEIKTPIIISSNLEINHCLKGKEKVFEICKLCKAEIYINPIGGVELYDKNEFKQNNIELKLIQTEIVEYTQFGNSFIPYLSIIDVIMFNNKEQIKEMMIKYKTI